MNSKFSSRFICLFVILAGISLVIPDTRAQAQPQAQTQTPPPPQPQPQTPQAQPQTPPAAAALPAATNALPKSSPGEITLYNGVKMEVMRPADGPRPEPNAIVQIQYIGHLEDGTEFTRSYSRRYPSIYKLSDVIGCWQTGIPEMNVGSKVKFTCPPGSANGRRPVDFIWGDTTLYFIIELIAIVG